MQSFIAYMQQLELTEITEQDLVEIGEVKHSIENVFMHAGIVPRFETISKAELAQDNPKTVGVIHFVEILILQLKESAKVKNFFVLSHLDEILEVIRQSKEFSIHCDCGKC